MISDDSRPLTGFSPLSAAYWQPIYMYVCMYVYIYIHTHTHAVSIYIYIHTHTHTQCILSIYTGVLISP